MRATIVTTVLLGLACAAVARAHYKSVWAVTRYGAYGDLPLTLIPVGEPKNAKLANARHVWSGLVKEMARDADTQKLLRKLLNCKVVKVAVLPKKVDGRFRPAAPTGTSQLYLGIRLSGAREGKGDLTGCLVGKASYLALEVPSTRQWKLEATDWHAFVIAANEYLHRNKKGYHLHHGQFLELADLKEAGALNPDKRGKYVEKRINTFLKAYKD
jgi:hypothetical protein